MQVQSCCFANLNLSFLRFLLPSPSSLIKLPSNALSEVVGNRWHFATPPLVSPRIDVLGTSAKIPYWWRITTVQIFHWLKKNSLTVYPIRSTAQIWIVTRHQYGISALVSQTSFRGKTSDGLAKCWLFSQASKFLASVTLSSKLFAVSDRSRCGGYLWHGQYGIYIKSIFRYALQSCSDI